MKEEEKESCVNCGKLTQYTKNTPIELRYDYIENGGQLCTECANKLNINHGKSK